MLLFFLNNSRVNQVSTWFGTIFTRETTSYTSFRTYSESYLFAYLQRVTYFHTYTHVISLRKNYINRICRSRHIRCFILLLLFNFNIFYYERFI
jgi:hypothetical protein